MSCNDLLDRDGESGLMHVGMALDHFPFFKHFSILAPRNSNPLSHVNVMLSPIV